MASAISLVTGSEREKYIKKLEAFCAKLKERKNLTVNEKYDKITKAENLELYDWFTQKLIAKPYSLAVFANQYETLRSGREEFVSLSPEIQSITLLNILLLFKTYRSGGCDFSSIGGSPASGIFAMSSKLSNWKKYSDVRIVDTSATGLRERVSGNLLELL